MADLTPTQQRALTRSVNRALANAWDRLAAVDAVSQRLILDEYEAAADEAVRALQAAADADGNVPVAALQQVIGRVNMALEALRVAQQALIEQQVLRAAEAGAAAIDELRSLAAAGAISAASIARLPDAATTAASVFQQIANLPGDDGLTLSDRIWRNHRMLRDELLPAIQRSVILGEEARAAVRGALQQATAATAEQIGRIELARAGALADHARAVLASPEARAYSNALRVVRTEADRANIMSTREAIYAVEDVAGTRFLLSPNHPRFDICDLHASVNLHGLGTGVYPRGSSPLPAHPNTLSFEEAVFVWEISDADRAQRDDPVAWLQGRSVDEQLGVLQSRDKLRVLARLKPEDLTRPWHALRGQYDQAGDAA